MFSFHRLTYGIHTVIGHVHLLDHLSPIIGQVAADYVLSSVCLSVVNIVT